MRIIFLTTPLPLEVTRHQENWISEKERLKVPSFQNQMKTDEFVKPMKSFQQKAYILSVPFVRVDNFINIILRHFTCTIHTLL